MGTDGARQLILLEGEEIYDQIPGVMNLSKDYGQLGIFWVTSLRLCWAAQLQDNYNCSLPYLQVRASFLFVRHNRFIVSIMRMHHRMRTERFANDEAFL